MPNEKLGELLKQLQDELERTEAVDDKGRAMLADIDADIHKLLSQSSNSGEQQSMQGRLQVAIEHFEVEHPAITAALSQLLNTLSNAGI
jgi:hypothetical protein